MTSSRAFAVPALAGLLAASPGLAAYAQQTPGGLMNVAQVASWQSMSNLMAAIFLGLTVAVFYLKHKIYQSRGIGVTLRDVVRHPAFGVLAAFVVALYLCFMLPAGFYKCLWREYFRTRYYPFLTLTFLGLQPVLIFYTFYASEKLHILGRVSAAVFRKSRMWVIALNVLLCCALSVFLIFAWQALTASTRYSFIHAVYKTCKVVL